MLRALIEACDDLWEIAAEFHMFTLSLGGFSFLLGSYLASEYLPQIVIIT